MATMLLSGCVANTESTTGTKTLDTWSTVDTVEYPEYGYVCFIASTGRGGGIDCEPITNN
jgi:hypothetical protein